MDTVWPIIEFCQTQSRLPCSMATDQEIKLIDARTVVVGERGASFDRKCEEADGRPIFVSYSIMIS